MAKTLTGIGYSTQNQIDYRKQLESILNNKKKELVRQQQQEIIKVYEKAYKDIIEKGLKKAGGDKAKIDKLTKVYAEQIYNELELIVKQYNADMSSTIETMQAEIMMSMNIFEKGDYYEFKEAVDKAVNVANRKIVQQMVEGKVYHDGKGLDKRIWDSSKMSGTKMRDAINSCIAQGMGAAEMSQNLKEFAMGGHHTWSRNKIREKLGDGYARKYGSGGLDYEALRLARTTLTHQAQIAVINSSKINPYLQFVKWHSDHQAGRTCQQCIDRDGQLFKIDEVPLDHPNGMCWIQPVYSIDGKTEATPEEIAKDMKAWAEGSKNSKLMDKIPEYKGLGGTKKPAKTTKKTTTRTTKKTTKQQTPKGEFNKLTTQQINGYKKKFVEDMSKQTNIDYLDEVAEALKGYPEHIQQAYYKASRHLKGFQETNKDEAWYNPWRRKVCMDAANETKIAQSRKYNKFEVWFHETGHMMDDLLQLDKDEFRSSDKPLSANESFIKALKKDFSNIKKRIDNQYMDMFELTKDEYKAKYPTTKAKNKLYRDVLYDELADNNRTKGIQDMIEGLSNADIRIRWGHGKQYWNRKNRSEEVASEAWANICGSYCDKETLELMQKYFPKATEELNTIIKNRLKELK